MKFRLTITLLAALLLSAALWTTEQSANGPSVAHAQDGFSCANVSEIPQEECEALVAIYEANPSATLDGWLTTEMPCSWLGIQCIDNRITELTVRRQRLRSLPSEIGDLAALTSLVIYDNLLTGLPPEIGNLTALKELDLRFNQLTDLPPEIGNLTSLARLDLYSSELLSLPSEIGKLTSLKNLVLEENNLSSLPAEIGNLSALTGLYIRRNNLTSLPPQIGNLASLTFLDVVDNSLTSLPMEIGYLASLEGLNVEGNPLTSQPVQIATTIQGNGTVTRDIPGPYYVASTNAQLTVFPDDGWQLQSATCENAADFVEFEDGVDLTLGEQDANCTITFTQADVPSTLAVCASNGDFTNIQPAIDAIAPGGTIDICPGTYPENITVNKNLTLRGAGSDTTTISPYDNTTVLIPSGVDVIIEDLGITTSITECCGPSGSGIDNSGKLLVRGVDIYDNGRGLFNRDGEVDIVLSTIRENNRSYVTNSGSGVRNENGIVRISQSTIWGNSMSGPDEDVNDGAGIWNNGTMTITETTIRDNAGAQGGGIYNNLGEMTIIDSRIANNVSLQQGAGIFNDDRLSIVRTTIEENSTVAPIFGRSCSAFGGGIANSAIVTMTDSLVKSNNSGDYPENGDYCSGGGIFTHGRFTANNLTVIDNKSSMAGGIYVGGGILNLTDSSVLDNYASEIGAGIVNEGQATILRTTVSGNSAFGGGAGILNRGQFEVIESSIRENDSFTIGTGILNSGPMTINRSTIHNNYSDDGSGAGIFNSSALTITNSTISDNDAPDARGVGIATNDGTVRITNSTIANNRSRYQNDGAGIHTQGDSIVYLQNSILSGNTISSDFNPQVLNCSGTIISLGNNIANDDSCTLQSAADQPNTDPLIGPLVDNGGPTLTHLLLDSSLAINAGNSSGCPATDQRGIARPQGSGCDIGSIELEGVFGTTCGPLLQEAETGTLTGNWTVGDDASASGGQYIVVPDTDTAVTAAQADADAVSAAAINRHKASYCFGVTTPGVYRVLGGVYAEDGRDNSFFVQVDGAPTNGYTWDIPRNTRYDADYLNNRNGMDPVEVTLAAGDHVVDIFLREDGARLDKIALILMDETGPVIPPPPPSGCQVLGSEGEDGVLFGNFAVMDDVNASGGQYVAQPIPEVGAAGGDSLNVNRRHRADYCISVPEAGDYRIRTQVLAPSHSGNSFFVQVDGGPEAGTLYDIFPVSRDPENGTYITDYVSQRGGADPMVYTLEPGDHTISFILRENGARLDSFMLEPVTVQAASVTVPSIAELRANLAAEGEAPEMDSFIFVPLMVR